MRRFFDSGWAFMTVALICFLAAIVAENKGALAGIGGFWMIMAIIVRSRSAKKTSGDKGKGDA